MCPILGGKTKRCATCGEVKPLSAFYRDKTRSKGVDHHCKICENKRHIPRKRAAGARARAKRAAARHNAHVFEWKKYLWRLAGATKSERKREWARAHRKRVPEKCAARVAKRFAEQMLARPCWWNAFFVAEIYALAAKRSKLTGIQWEVDHIVPIKSPLVCGLHWERNLRVIPASENLKKGNRHWPDMSPIPTRLDRKR